MKPQYLTAETLVICHKSFIGNYCNIPIVLLEHVSTSSKAMTTNDVDSLIRLLGIVLIIRSKFTNNHVGSSLFFDISVEIAIPHVKQFNTLIE